MSLQISMLFVVDRYAEFAGCSRFPMRAHVKRQVPKKIRNTYINKSFNSYTSYKYKVTEFYFLFYSVLFFKDFTSELVIYKPI